MPRTLVWMVTACAWMLAAAGARAETRLALVIGNSAYAHTTALANPLNDAREMAIALRRAGFDVVEALDADKRAFDLAIRKYTDKLGKADVALFFYAGHGLQVGAQNFLVPIDAKLERERDLDFEAVKLEFVMRQMEIDREGKTSIVFLDACRDNPLSRNLARAMGTRSASVGRGLAAAATGLGTFIAYATQPGNVALDGEGRNSPFTAALVKQMSVAGRNLPATMIEVRKDVVSATNGRQVPWDHSALTGDFYFVPGSVAPAAAPVTTATIPSTSPAEVAALQERLRKLEGDAKRREVAGANPAVAGADAIKLAELRARAASLDEITKDLQRKLMTALSTQARAADKDERAKLSRDVSNIQMEMGRRNIDLSRLRAEIAALEGGRDGGGGRHPGFTVFAGERIDGEALAAPPSTANCESRCQSESACVGYSLSRDGVCELFGAVRGRNPDAHWRSGVRADVRASAATLPVIAKAKPEKESPNFEVTDNVGLVGAEIRSFRAPSPIACREACETEAACVGFQHGRKVPVMRQCQLFSRVDARQADQQWQSGLRKTNAAQ